MLGEDNKLCYLLHLNINSKNKHYSMVKMNSKVLHRFPHRVVD